MLRSLLEPGTIAIIGASQEPRRPGGQCFQALTEYGYAGKVYPVNPRYHEIRGRRCYGSIREVPEACDLAVLALPAADVPAAIDACGEARVKTAVILSAGFREIGEAGAGLQAQLEAAVRRSGVRVVGPNCVGILNLRRRVFAGFGAGFRNPDWRTGPVALVSQSGGFAYSIGSYCQEAGVGFDYLASTGNEVDCSMLDFVEYFLDRPEIELVALYVEGLQDGRRLRALGRKALAAGKPIAVWKVGNTGSGGKAAVSHTANLTVDYDYYRDAFREGGFVEIQEIYDLVDAAKVFRARKRPRSTGTAIVTTSGGAGVVLADRCEEAGLTLPTPGAETIAALRSLVPGFASLANPVDVTAALAQDEAKYSKATEIICADPAIDSVIVRSFPGRDVAAWAEHLKSYAAASPKTILVSLSGTAGQAAAWMPLLEDAGVPCFEAPGRAARAAAMLCEFARRCAQPVRTAVQRSRERVVLPIPSGATLLDEHEAKQCLEAYGIATPRRVFVPREDSLHAIEDAGLSFPVVAKIVSADPPHKTEASAVRVGIQDMAELRAVLPALRGNVAAYDAKVRIAGFLVEEMAQGLEMIVGALNSAAFGPMVLVGMGGVYAELLRDVARRFAPVDAEAALEMLATLKAGALLRGYRGHSGFDLPALSETIARVSWMIADHEDRIAEIEVNPVIVGPAGAGVKAVDAVLRLKPPFCPGDRTN